MGVSGGHCEDIWRALGGLWRVVRVGAGGLIYRQIKSLHCSGYLLVRSQIQDFYLRVWIFLPHL